MVIDLRPPSAPGFRLPPPPQRRLEPLFDDLDAPYYKDAVERGAGPRALGTIRGGPTLSQALDIVRPNPKKWTTVSPYASINTPILGDLTAPPVSGTAKVGTFNLNLIEPFQSFTDATGPGIGRQPGPAFAGGTGLETAFDVFGNQVTPAGVLNWQGDLPVRLMERPLAFVQTLGSGILGLKSPTADTEGEAVYPFQKDPLYWGWLSTATEEQLVQQARAVAGSYFSPGRNQALFDTLMNRFRQDRDFALSRSSGSDEIDWHAIKAANGFELQGGGRLARINPVGHLVGTAPFVGFNLQNFVDPVTDEERRIWEALPRADRGKFLADAGLETTLLNLAGILPLFAGAGAVAGMARMSTVPAVAKMGSIWAYSLKAANISMALGFTFTTAAWALEAFAPRNMGGEFGETVNLASPISHSALGGILNQVGFFASGSFGVSLAARATGRLGGFVAGGVARGADARLTGGRITGLMGERELSFFSHGFGGSKMTTAFERGAGVAKTDNELGIKDSLISFVLHADDAKRTIMRERILAGESINDPVLAGLTKDEQIAFLDADFVLTYDATHARVASAVRAFEQARQHLPLLHSDVQARGAKAIRDGVRSFVDDADRALSLRYDTAFFGRTLGEVRASVESRLKQAGYKPDMAYFDRELGAKDNAGTRARWTQAARLAHQLGFVNKKARLERAQVGSHEQATTLFSQRTLFEQDIEEAVQVLIGADAAAARVKVRELILGKDRVDELYAAGVLGDRHAQVQIDSVDPIRLADQLQSILEQAGAPRRRGLVDPTEPTANEPLNVFHTELAGEGVWDLGFRSKVKFDPEVRYALELERALTPAEMRAQEPSRFLVRDVQPKEVPEGYVEITPGQQLRRKNWYALDPIYSSDGRYFVKDDGTLVLAPAPPATPAGRPTNTGDPMPIQEGHPGWNELSIEEQRLAREPLYSYELNEGTFPNDYALETTGEVKSGRNAGADWPILRDAATGDRYLFKARRNPGGELADLSEARKLGGVVAGKLFEYLGLHTAREVPFTWGGTKGTLQKLVDVDRPVLVADLKREIPEVVNATVNQHIADWFTAQHDSNSDSLLLSNDGSVYGVDKGQAYKYVADDRAGELEAMTDGNEFWDYRYDAADTHLGEYIRHAVEQDGVKLDRSAVEQLVQRIESMPEDVYLGALRPLAEARVADGRFEKFAQEFYDNALTRKRNVRFAVNKAFEELGYAGLERPGNAQVWAPGAKGLLDVGTPTRVNERPIPLEELYAYNDANPVAEPEAPATVDHYKAGVVVVEPDGRLWFILDSRGAPTGATYAKGHVDGGETFQRAAIREAQEELGLSVRLKSHLADLPNDAGNVTRYYIAERVSGGPEHVGTPKEIARVFLMDEGQAAGFLMHSPRDMAVLEALNRFKAGEHAKIEVDGLHADGPEAVTTGNPAADWGYVSHVKLRNGQVWRSPWLDVGPAEAAQINLGNRGMLGRAFDDVFTGWKTWRLMETQKASLTYRLTRDYAGVSPAQVDLYFSKLLELQRESKASMQGMAGATNEMLPGLGYWALKVRAAANEVFGEGPFLNSKTGLMDAIDWNKVTVQSFRTSAKLNVTAGVTSYLKAIPGLGSVIIPITDFYYPTIRFGLSLLFKGGEIVESSMLNGMRGTMFSGDPFIDALYWKAGAGNGLGVLMSDVSSDMMLTGLTMGTFSGTKSSRTGDAPFMYEKLNPRLHAKQVANELRPQPAAPEAPRSNLSDSLSSDRLEAPDPDRFPDRYADETPRFLLRNEIDPSTGDVMVDFGGGANTERQVAAFRDRSLGALQAELIGDPARAEAYGHAFAFERSLRKIGAVEKLADVIPYAHHPVTRSGGTSRQISFVEDAIKGGYPMFSGNLSTGLYSLLASERAGGGTAIEAKESFAASGTTVTAGEQVAGFADAKYGGTAEFYEGNGGMLAILKGEKLKESVTVDQDRINYEHDVHALQEAMMTPAAVNGISRIVIQRMIVEWAAEYPSLTLLEYLAQQSDSHFGSIRPFEMAYMKGINFEDVATLMLPTSARGEWESLVQTYRDHPNAKGLGEVPVTYYEESTARGSRGSHREAMWANALERAGLTDLGLSHPDTAVLSPEQAIAALPDWAITPATERVIGDRIDSAARARLNIRASLSHSDLDAVQIRINSLRMELKQDEASAAKAGAGKKGQGYGLGLERQREIAAKSRAYLADLEKLRADVESFWAQSPYDAATAMELFTRDALDPAGVIAGEWLLARGALTDRMKSMGVMEGSGQRQGEIRIEDTTNGEVLGRQAYEPQGLGEAFSKDVHSSTTPYELLRLKALLSEYQRRVPPGYVPQSINLFGDNALGPLVAGIDSPELRGIIKARAEQKLGHPLPSDPVIRSYVRGEAQWIQDRAGKPTVGEIVITVADGAGQPYGNLTLAELADLWKTYGLPKALAERAVASGFDPAGAGQIETSWGEASGEHLLHGPGTTPEGRLYYYRSKPEGQFEANPAGPAEYRDPKAYAAFDVRMAYAFEPGGKSYIALTDGHAYVKSGAEATVRKSGAIDVEYFQPSLTYPQWSYQIKNHVASGFATSTGREAMVALRDLFERTKPGPTDVAPTLVRLADPQVTKAFERLYIRREVPDWIIAVDKDGKVIDRYAVVDDVNGSPAMTEALPEAAAADFTEVKAAPEHFSEGLRRHLEAQGGRLARGAKEVWNPVNFKLRAQDRLTFKIVRGSFAPVLQQLAPKAAKVFVDLKVPEAKWADFLVHDRYLLGRWKQSGARADFEELVLHAETYSGKAGYEAARKELDSLYTAPEFETMMDAWRLAVRAAEDESYSVHFFSPYRSTFERSINHPLLGIYPASWAFKVAKEWYRFLYQNQTLGFRAGMVPAQVMKQLYNAQAQAWAQSNPETLEQWYQEGPLSSSIFIFNLLLPGDWSNIPFPFSRTIRDVARGNTNLYDLVNRNMSSIGALRDLRLGAEAAGEIWNAVTGTPAKGGAFERAHEGALPRIPTFEGAESVRSLYAYR